MVRRWPFSTTLGRFTGDRGALLLLMIAALLIAARAWLHEHPEHDPWAPLDLRDPPGWATQAKLRKLSDDPLACRAVLSRSGIAFTALPPRGEGACIQSDSTVLSDAPFRPAKPAATCPIAVGFELWQRNTLEPAAEQIFGQPIKSVEHLGTYSCRRMYGRSEGPWSEHATGNAIDIAAFVLSDGTRISVLKDWAGEGRKARFLRQVRDGACKAFRTVLSPDYNAAHRDHFHLDSGAGWGGACR